MADLKKPWADEPKGALTLAVAYEARDGRKFKADETGDFDRSESEYLLTTGRARHTEKG